MGSAGSKEIKEQVEKKYEEAQIPIPKNIKGTPNELKKSEFFCRIPFQPNDLCDIVFNLFVKEKENTFAQFQNVGENNSLWKTLESSFVYNFNLNYYEDTTAVNEIKKTVFIEFKSRHEIYNDYDLRVSIYASRIHAGDVLEKNNKIIYLGIVLNVQSSSIHYVLLSYDIDGITPIELDPYNIQPVNITEYSHFDDIRMTMYRDPKYCDEIIIPYDTSKFKESKYHYIRAKLGIDHVTNKIERLKNTIQGYTYYQEKFKLNSKEYIKVQRKIKKIQKELITYTKTKNRFEESINAATTDDFLLLTEYRKNLDAFHKAKRLEMKSYYCNSRHKNNVNSKFKEAALEDYKLDVQSMNTFTGWIKMKQFITPTQPVQAKSEDFETLTNEMKNIKQSNGYRNVNSMINGQDALIPNGPVLLLKLIEIIAGLGGNPSQKKIDAGTFKFADGRERKIFKIKGKGNLLFVRYKNQIRTKADLQKQLKKKIDPKSFKKKKSVKH